MANKHCLFYMLSALCIALALLCLGGCGSSADESEDNRIVYGALTEPISLCPLLGTDAASTEVQSLIYNALVRYDGDQNIIGDLAESWQVSADGRCYTFRLREGVLWHDGKPLSADDVVFTFAWAKDEKNGYLDRRELLNIVRVTADEREVSFLLAESDSAFLARISSVYIMPKHIWQEVGDLREEAPHIKPVGTGAYRFTAWEKAQYLQFAANDTYYRGVPAIKTLFYKIVPDTNVLAMQLRRGEVDVCHVDASAVEMLSADASVKLSSAPSRAYTYIALNHKNPIFADRRVRRAMLCAVQRQDIIDHILSGGAYLASADLAPTILKSHVAPLAYDPAEADRLLEEAGWTKGTDGIRTKDGLRLSYRLLVTNKNKRLGDVALAFRQNMRAIGIEVEIIPMDFVTLRAKHFLTGDYEACLISQRLPNDPLLREETWCSDGAGNHAQYTNPKIDALYQRARLERDETARREIFGAVQTILADDMVQLFLWYPAVLIGMRAELTGIDATHLGAKDNIFYNVETWTRVRE